MTKSVTTWMPLAAAYEHVLRHEQLDLLAKKRLHVVLADGRVHARARYMFLPNMPRREWERTDEPLPGKFWSCDVCRGSDFEETLEADVTWEESRASIKKHPLGDCDAFKIEVDQDELFAIWPGRKTSKAGRKPLHDREAILTEAAAEVSENGRPASLEEFAYRVESRMSSKSTDGNYPRRSFLMELLAAMYESLQESAN